MDSKVDNGMPVVLIADDDRNINYKDVERVLSVAKGINLEDDEVIIDIIPHRYIIDDAYDVKDPVGVKGTRLEVDTKVVVTNERVISEIYNCFKNLNVNVKGTMISAESAANILFSEGDDKENVALVDVGEENLNDDVDSTVGILFGVGSGSNKLKLLVGLALVIGIVVMVAQAGVTNGVALILTGFIAMLMMTFIGLVSPAILILFMVGGLGIFIAQKFILARGE